MSPATRVRRTESGGELADESCPVDQPDVDRTDDAAVARHAIHNDGSGHWPRSWVSVGDVLAESIVRFPRKAEGPTGEVAESRPETHREKWLVDRTGADRPRRERDTHGRCIGGRAAVRRARELEFARCTSQRVRARAERHNTREAKDSACSDHSAPFGIGEPSVSGCHRALPARRVVSSAPSLAHRPAKLA